MPRHLHNRRNLAKSLPVVSGKVTLFTEFAVVPGQGEGFMWVEIDAADLPAEAMYFTTNLKTGQLGYVMPEAIEGRSRHLFKTTLDPKYDKDPSYFWQDKARQAKENGEGNVATNRSLQTD